VPIWQTTRLCSNTAISRDSASFRLTLEEPIGAQQLYNCCVGVFSRIKSQQGLKQKSYYRPRAEFRCYREMSEFFESAWG